MQTSFGGDRQFRLSLEHRIKICLAGSHEHCSSGERPFDGCYPGWKPDKSTTAGSLQQLPHEDRQGHCCWPTASLQPLRNVPELSALRGRAHDCSTLAQPAGGLTPMLQGSSSTTALWTAVGHAAAEISLASLPHIGLAGCTCGAGLSRQAPCVLIQAQIGAGLKYAFC